MQIVIFLLVGSLLLGLYSEKLDRKATLGLLLMVVAALIGYYYFKRFL